jgi:hypothetical protein
MLAVALGLALSIQAGVGPTGTGAPEVAHARRPAAARAGRVGCPPNFAFGSKLSGGNRHPLVPRDGILQALICRYQGAPDGVPENRPSRVGDLLARHHLGRADAVSLGREVDASRPYPKSIREFNCAALSGPGFYVQFSMRDRPTVPVVVFLAECPRVVASTRGRWYELSPRLKTRLRALTSASVED